MDGIHRYFGESESQIRGRKIIIKELFLIPSILFKFGDTVSRR